MRNFARVRGWAPTLLAAVAAVAVVGAAADAMAQQRSRLVVYSSLDPERLDVFKRAFEERNPDVELVFQREGNDAIETKVVAANGAPAADALWGVSVTAAARLKAERLLDPLQPATLADIKPAFRDPANPPHWIGTAGRAAAVCFNTAEAARLGLSKPRSWQDLLAPAYRGRITMPHPVKSEVGFFHVAAWLQIYLRDAWKFMDGLNQNMAAYAATGAQPCSDAAAGTYPVGISYDLAGAGLKDKGAPIEVLTMSEGGGWDMDIVAVLKGTKNPAAARKLVDWATGREANEIYARYAGQVAVSGVATSVPGYPEGVAESLLKYDFPSAATSRTRITVDWELRYERKL